MPTTPIIFKINFRFSHPTIRFKKTADFIWQLAQNILLLHPHFRIAQPLQQMYQIFGKPK